MNMVAYYGSQVVDMKRGQCSLQAICRGVFLFIKPFKAVIELCYLSMLRMCTWDV